MNKGNILQGVDVLDVFQYVAKTNKKFQATFLNQLEDILGKDTPEFAQIRKIYLDTQNNYTRSVLTIIFGNIEDSTIK